MTQSDIVISFELAGKSIRDRRNALSKVFKPAVEASASPSIQDRAKFTRHEKNALEDIQDYAERAGLFADSFYDVTPRGETPRGQLFIATNKTFFGGLLGNEPTLNLLILKAGSGTDLHYVGTFSRNGKKDQFAWTRDFEKLLSVVRTNIKLEILRTEGLHAPRPVRAP